MDCKPTTLLCPWDFLQARALEWVCPFPSPGESSQSWGWNPGLPALQADTLLSEPPGTGHRMRQNKTPQCEGARDTCSGLTASCVWVGKTHTAVKCPWALGDGEPPEDIKQEWTWVLWKEHPPSQHPPQAPVGHKPAWLRETSKDAPFAGGRRLA